MALDSLGASVAELSVLCLPGAVLLSEHRGEQGLSFILYQVFTLYFMQRHPVTMTTVNFTPNLRRHVNCPTTQAEGNTVAEVLEKVFEKEPLLRGYVLDEQGAVRKHMVIFLNGTALRDRIRLSDPVTSQDSEIFVMQALSGG